MIGNLEYIDNLKAYQFEKDMAPREIRLFFGNHGVKIYGKIIIPACASNSNPVPGAVLCHGIGADHRVMESSALLLVGKGVATLLLDIRGHGRSEGTLDGYFYKDVVDAWKVLSSLPVVDSSRIALIGHSLGAFSSILATSEIDKPKVLVTLACPYEIENEILSNHNHRIHRLAKWFISLIGKMTISLCNLKARVDWKKFVTSWMQMKISSSLAELDECSKLFVFSEKDPVSPFQKFSKLYEQAPGPKQKMVTRGSHVTSVEAEIIRFEWVGWTVAALNRSEMVA
jgi:esterase/lipase